jgi:beta-glucosidase
VTGYIKTIQTGSTAAADTAAKALNRFFAARNQQPMFAFGHGLSYARFGYESLELRRTGPGDIELSFGIVNDSPRPGHEVAQLYLRCPEAAAEPPLQLKGFTRVHLGAGERRAVTFTLTPADLAAWSDPDGWTGPSRPLRGSHRGILSRRPAEHIRRGNRLRRIRS